MLKTYKIWRNFLKFTSLLSIIIVLICFYHYANKQTKSILTPAEGIIDTYAQNMQNAKNYEIAIENSLFKGFSKDAEPYKIYSKYAYKTPDNKYKLTLIDASYKFAQQQLLVFAKEGWIDEQQKLLYLKNNIQLSLDDLKFFGNQINLDLASKNLSSQAKIKLQYKNSVINANSFDTQQSNQILNFRGNVKTKINFNDF